MKNKLKTLKDFETENKTFDKTILTEEESRIVANSWKNSRDVFKSELKAEAVKWVKEISKNDIDLHEKSEDFIKIFFNLTEEELKNVSI